MRNVFPATVSYLVEGSGGDRCAQFVCFTIFPAKAIRDRHFPIEGQGMIAATGQLWDKAIAKVSEKRLDQFFNGWDTSNKNDWNIVAMSGSQQLCTDFYFLSPVAVRC